MKKSEFKKIIKPIVKECIQEVLFTEGLLSNIISEVVRGIKGEPLVEREERELKSSRKIEEQLVDEETERRRTKIRETKKKMLEAVNAAAYNGIDLFEGTAPLGTAGNLNAVTTPAGPLEGVDPRDAGIDISGLMGNKKAWNVLLEGKT